MRGGAVRATNLNAFASSDTDLALYKSGTSSLTVRNSELHGTLSVNLVGGDLKVISSELDGPVFGEVKCVGDYDKFGAEVTNGTFGTGSGCISTTP